MKTMYIRETNPESGKQKWVRINGVQSDGVRLSINPNVFSLVSRDAFQDLYTKRRKR